MTYLRSLKLVMELKQKCGCGGQLIVDGAFQICDECGLIHSQAMHQSDKVIRQHSTEHDILRMYHLGTCTERTIKDSYYAQRKLLLRAIAYFEFPKPVKDRAVYHYGSFLAQRPDLLTKDNWRKLDITTIVAVSLLLASRELKYPLLTKDLFYFFKQNRHNISSTKIREFLEETHASLPLLHPSVCLEKVLSTISFLGDPPHNLINFYMSTYLFFSACNPYLFAVTCVCLAYHERYSFPFSLLFKHFDYNYTGMLRLAKNILLKSQQIETHI